MSAGLLAMEIPLEIRQTALARRSSRETPWSVEFAREIGTEDLVLLHSVTRVGPSDPKAPLANIREPHHMLAQMVAKDDPVVKISAVTGYTPARIRALQNDPAFSELVEHYREQEQLEGADIQAQVRHATLIANQLLLERLEEEPESFSNKELQALRDAGLDRIGHGPKATVNHNLNDPTDIISKLKDLLAVESQGRILSRHEIEAEYTEVTYVETEASEGAEVGETDADGAVPGTETQGPGGGGIEIPKESPQKLAAAG